MCALTILRYITDNANELSPSVVTRLLDNHGMRDATCITKYCTDTIISLIYVVERSPWTRRAKGKIFKFLHGKWTSVSAEDSLKITQHEAQAWLTLNNFLVDPVFRKSYNYSTFRRENVIKLKRFMNEVLIDQIPVLVDLHRVVEELHFSIPPEIQSSKRMFVVEQVPLIREKILKSTNFESIASMQASTLFAEDDKSKKEQILRLAKMFNQISDMMQKSDTTNVEL